MLDCAAELVLAVEVVGFEIAAVEVVGFEIAAVVAAAVVAAAVVAAVVAQCAAVIVVGAADELAALASFGASWAVVGPAPVVV